MPASVLILISPVLWFWHLSPHLLFLPTFLWSLKELTLVYINTVLDWIQITLNYSRASYSSQTFLWHLSNRLFWDLHKGKPEATVGNSLSPSVENSENEIVGVIRELSAWHLDILSKKQGIGLLGRKVAHEKAFCCEVVSETKRR